ncbi:MAG: RNA ligase family protein [Nanopusillaceae archaeon]
MDICIEEAIDSFNIKDLENYLKEFRWGLEQKIDGVRCLMTVEKSRIIIRSRNNKELNIHSMFKDDLENIKDYVGYTFDGELFKDNFNLTNGLIHRSNPTESVDFYIFDIFKTKTLYSCNPYEVKYEDRKEQLSKIFQKNMFKNFKLVGYKEKVYKSLDSFNDDIDTYISRGFEGIVIKKIHSFYIPRRTSDWLKGKKFLTLDLRIGDIEVDKIRHWAKAILVDYKGKYLAVGSGLSNKLRYDLYNNPDNYIGKIVEVKFMEKTSNGVFRQPVFVRFRDDKSKPDA